MKIHNRIRIPKYIIPKAGLKQNWGSHNENISCLSHDSSWLMHMEPIHLTDCHAQCSREGKRRIASLQLSTELMQANQWLKLRNYRQWPTNEGRSLKWCHLFTTLLAMDATVNFCGEMPWSECTQSTRSLTVSHSTRNSNLMKQKIITWANAWPIQTGMMKTCHTLGNEGMEICWSSPPPEADIDWWHSINSLDKPQLQ